MASKSQLRINDPLEMKIIKKALVKFINQEHHKYDMKFQMQSINLYKKVAGLIHSKPSPKLIGISVKQGHFKI